jgi:ribonuclease R
VVQPGLRVKYSLGMSNALPTRADVLKLLGGEDRAVHAREIAKALGVSDAKYQGFLRLLDNLVFDGVLQARDGHKFRMVSRGTGGGWRAPKSAREFEAEAEAEAGVDAEPEAESTKKGGHVRAAEAGPERIGGRKGRDEREKGGRRERGRGDREEREGTISVNARGFGFVSSPTASGDDVFIPGESLRGAMHGDRVRIEIVGRGPRGAEGTIVEIVSRGTPRVSGILRRRGKSAWLEPDDTRVRGPIVLPIGIDAKDDSGNSGKDGDAVIVQITRFPDSPNENPEGRLEVVLGKPGELNVEARKVLVMAQIDEAHSLEAFAEADAYGAEVPQSMLEGREDLTHLPLPTIDPEDARDHDDAVWVERTDAGGYRAWIAIADVSSYVRPGMRTDDEAKKRGCSVYLPDRAIPMLPRPLSSNLCSLLPDVVRLCLCVDVTLDSAGRVLSRRLVRGFMKSQAKLTYGGVARALGLSEEPPRDPKADELVEGLKVANELSRALRGKRMKRGSLEFDLPEAKIKLGEDGQPVDITRRAQDPGMKKAYQLIEELMLLGNEMVAEWLVEKQLPGIFRIHEAPDEKKLERLASMCAHLGVEFDADDAKDPLTLAELVKSWASHPLSNVLNMLLLRSMKQAAYDVRNLGHFGLASKAYLHFTSPIRRYPDLVVHRTVHRALLGEKIDRSAEAQKELEDAAIAASAAERRAMEVEREIVDLYGAVLMRSKIGETFEGVVTGLVGSGVFVSLDAPFVNVLIKLEDLGAGTYALDDEGLEVIAAGSGDVVRLGDRLTLDVIDVAIQRRTVYGRRIRALEDTDGSRPRRERLKPAKPAKPVKHEKHEAKGGRRDKHGHKARAAQAQKTFKKRKRK